MSSTMLRAAETVTNKLEKVNPNSVIVDYKGGKADHYLSRFKSVDLSYGDE